MEADMSELLDQTTVAPSTAEVDAEALEHCGGPEVGGHDVANSRLVQKLTHVGLHVSVSRVAGPPWRRYDPRHMPERIDDALRRSALFRRLALDNRQRLAAVAGLREYTKGSMLFQRRRRVGVAVRRGDRAREGIQIDAARHRHHPGNLRSRRPGRRGRRLRVAALSGQRDCTRTDPVPAGPQSRVLHPARDTPVNGQGTSGGADPSSRRVDQSPDRAVRRPRRRATGALLPEARSRHRSAPR